MIHQSTRRGLIAGMASFLAAPAIVRASSLMAISAANLRPDVIANQWEYVCEYDPIALTVKCRRIEGMLWAALDEKVAQ